MQSNRKSVSAEPSSVLLVMRRSYLRAATVACKHGAALQGRADVYAWMGIEALLLNSLKNDQTARVPAATHNVSHGCSRGGQCVVGRECREHERQRA